THNDFRCTPCRASEAGPSLWRDAGHVYSRRLGRGSGAAYRAKRRHLRHNGVGPSINTLPLRVKVAPEARVAEWLAAVQMLQSEDRRHGQAPLAEIQRHAGGGAELFPTLVVVENY